MADEKKDTTPVDEECDFECTPEHHHMFCPKWERQEFPFKPVAESGSREPANQCDGCKLGLPINVDGNHYFENKTGDWASIYMSCTAHKYTAVAEQTPSQGEGQLPPLDVTDAENKMGIFGRGTCLSLLGKLPGAKISI